jgi:MFS family permease
MIEQGSGAPDEIGEETTYRAGPFRGLTANVVRLGVVSFFADVSSEMLYPLTPLFLTLVLGAPVAAVGLIEGVAEATASLLKTVSGRLSDRSGRRRPYVFLGYILSAIGKPLLALASGWPVVLGARVVDRLGKGLRTSPRDALLADSVTPEMRGRAYGWHRAMDTMGAVLGPLLSLVLLVLLTGDAGMQHIPKKIFQELFLLAFIPGIIGSFIVLAVREHRRPPKQATAPPSIRFSALPAPFRGYLVAWGIFALANSSDVFLFLRAKDLQFAPGIIILLYVLYNFVYAGTSPSLGQLSDRLGRKVVLIGGLLVFALVYLGFAFATAQWHLWVLFAIYGLYTAATDGVGKALAVDLVPAEIRASGIGLLGTVTGVATLLASSVAGVLWSVGGHLHLGMYTFCYGALGAILGAVLLARIRVVKMG